MFKKGHKINIGTHRSIEVKEKMSNAQKGRKKSVEHKAKIHATKLKKRQKKVDMYLENPNYCMCGCGKIVMPDPNRGGFYLRKFIEGHFDRSKYNPMAGRKQTKETKEKISKANSGNIIWNKGKTKETEPGLMRISKNMIENNPMSREDVYEKLQNSLYKSSHVKCKWHQYHGQRLQGNFELKFAKFLDSIDIKWISHKGVESFKYIGLDKKEHKYYPDFRDENGTYYDPHSKYYWNEEFEYKINAVKKNNPEKKFIVFHEENYLEMCNLIIEEKLSKEVD